MRLTVTAFILLVFSLLYREQHLPDTAVRFSTSDTTLQRVFNRAEELARKNIIDLGGRKVMIEGAQYRNMWLETQPMGGYMYAARDLEIARNNIEIFIDLQRDDGRFPGVIYNRNGVPLPNYAQLQGFCLPYPAWELYFLSDRDTVFLRRVYTALEKFDAYLWRTRDSDNNGCLESWCIYDTGEDHSVRFNDFPNAWSFDFPPTKEAAARLTKEELAVNCKEDSYDSTKTMTVPIESMDIMSYSYSCRDVLSLASGELQNGKQEYWRSKAEEVKRKLKEYLWDEDKAACFDRDKDNKTMPILLHNNLRCMYFGSFGQEMADRFVKLHLMNPNEFRTPVPLPSIAANDPSFRNIPGNNWSGQPQGLTYQRSIQALENYGHYSELTALSLKFLQVTGDSLMFTQQYDPFTAKPGTTQNGYGPSILAALEFISRLYGIHITQDRIYWSCLKSTFDYEYTQEWNKMTFTLKTKGDKVLCYVNGNLTFTFTKGIRVVTDYEGGLIEAVGIANEPETVKITSYKIINLAVRPDSICKLRPVGGNGNL
jgi:hypothetical protein